MLGLQVLAGPVALFFDTSIFLCNKGSLIEVYYLIDRGSKTPALLLLQEKPQITSMGLFLCLYKVTPHFAQ